MKTKPGLSFAIMAVLFLLALGGSSWKATVNSSNAFIEFQNLGFDLEMKTSVKHLRYVRRQPIRISMENVPSVAWLRDISVISVTKDVTLSEEVVHMLKQNRVEIHFLTER